VALDWRKVDATSRMKVFGFSLSSFIGFIILFLVFLAITTYIKAYIYAKAGITPVRVGLIAV
jgi:hypothetical protein